MSKEITDPKHPDYVAPVEDPKDPPKDPPKNPDEWFVKIKQEEFDEMKAFIEQAKTDKKEADQKALDLENAKKIEEGKHMEVIWSHQKTIEAQQAKIEATEWRYASLSEAFNADIEARADALAERMPEANAQAMRDWLATITDPIARRWMVSTFEALVQEPGARKPTNGWSIWWWAWDPPPKDPTDDPAKVSDKDVKDMDENELDAYLKAQTASYNKKYWVETPWAKPVE